MFIVNIEDLDREYRFYKCDIEKSRELVYHGFPLLGIFDDKYYFTITQELIDYLNIIGGENASGQYS